MYRIKAIVLAFAIISITGKISGNEFIVTASRDNTAKLWDLRGNCLVTLQGHEDWIYSAAFNPAGDSIVTASRDNTAKLWDLRGNCLVTFEGHTKEFRTGVLSAAFNPIGDRIVTASVDKTAKLWDLRGNCLATFQGHTGSVLSAAFRPAGDSIITASEDGTAKLWDLDGYCLKTFQGHLNRVKSATFNPRSDRILTVSWDGTAKLWDLYGNCLITFQEYSNSCSAVFNPMSNHIVIAFDDGTAKLWNLNGSYLATLEGHSNSIYSAAFNPAGNYIVTASDDGTAKLWDLRGNCLVTFQGHSASVTLAAFNPTGDRILTVSDDGTAKLWDLQGNCLTTLQGHKKRVSSANFSPQDIEIPLSSQYPFQTQQTVPRDIEPVVAPLCEPPSSASLTTNALQARRSRAMPQSRHEALDQRGRGRGERGRGLDRPGRGRRGRPAIFRNIFDTDWQDPNKYHNLIVFSSQGDLDDVKQLLREGVDPNIQSQDGQKYASLHLATMEGHYDIVLALLEARANPSIRDFADYTPLHFAAKGNSPGMVRLLIKYGASKTAKTKLRPMMRHQNPCVTPFEITDDSNIKRIIQVTQPDPALIALSRRKRSSNDYPQGEIIPLLHFEAHRGSVEGVEMGISQCGENPNLSDSQGWTALHWAAQENHYKVVQTLLDLGADKTLQTRDGLLAEDLTTDPEVRHLIQES